MDVMDGEDGTDDIPYETRLFGREQISESMLCEHKVGMRAGMGWGMW